MGVYLDSRNPFGLFEDEASSLYFIDKTKLLEELIPLVAKGGPAGVSGSARKSNKYICITRPRRFGKTMAASMIASFFGMGADSRELFRHLQIGKSKDFDAHINSHHVICISFHEIPVNCTNYRQYIRRVEKRLCSDLKKAYPNAEIHEEDAVWDILSELYESEDARFLFVLDEWDYIFHRSFVTEQDKKDFLEFLSNLLKGKSYVELAYMTGILPIAKYSSGSELNMFYEYTMASEEKYSTYFGFTETEVDELFRRYQALHPNAQKVTRDGLRLWYDGYHTRSGERVYNPRSVVAALTNNNLGNYWTSSGPYDELFYYVKENVAAVRDDLAMLVSGIPVRANVREYAATSMKLTTKDEILSAMVVYGFLNYTDGCVSIPNKELMNQFTDMLQKEPSLGYVHRLAAESARMLRATLAGDTGTMCRILEYAHDTESPLLYYNNETELTMLVNMVYLSARDTYRMEREDKAGTGYADFLFYPMKKDEDCLILELKIDHTPAEAIQQIKDRKYALRFCRKPGGISEYTGRILAVGITYHKADKKHCCQIEVLREKIT